MTEYRLHGWRSGTQAPPAPSVSLDAQSPFHGAALALRQFLQAGCDINAPLTHVDMTEPDGLKHTLLVEEVLEWLRDPKQAAFVHSEDLAALLR